VDVNSSGTKLDVLLHQRKEKAGIKKIGEKNAYVIKQIEKGTR